MSKDSDPNKWDYPPHTKAKHDILASYLDGWYPILSRWSGRILFFDGFAGKGRYESGELGSPIIAMQRLLDHHRFPQMQNREFVFYFVEADKENFESLAHEIEQFKQRRAPWPHNVRVHYEHATFDKTAGDLIAYMQEQKTRLAPTFAFVDPFGYSGLPLELLANLLDYPKTEVFVNFMVGHVQRFIERDGQENAMRGLFGMDVRDILADFDGENRVEHLKKVYARQLQERARFDYVQSFAMKNSTGNIGYYLFHGTRHRLGVKLMKAAMWKVDPGGGFSFSDRLADDEVLFTLTPDIRPLQRDLLSHYAGISDVPIEDIEWHTILHTPFRETHVRTALKPLEANGQIAVRRLGKSGYAIDKTWINFPARP